MHSLIKALCRALFVSVLICKSGSLRSDKPFCGRLSIEDVNY